MTGGFLCRGLSVMLDQSTCWAETFQRFTRNTRNVSFQYGAEKTEHHRNGCPKRDNSLDGLFSCKPFEHPNWVNDRRWFCEPKFRFHCVSRPCTTKRWAQPAKGDANRIARYQRIVTRRISSPPKKNAEAQAPAFSTLNSYGPRTCPETRSKSRQSCHRRHRCLC